MTQSPSYIIILKMFSVFFYFRQKYHSPFLRHIRRVSFLWPFSHFP